MVRGPHRTRSGQTPEQNGRLLRLFPAATLRAAAPSTGLPLSRSAWAANHSPSMGVSRMTSTWMLLLAGMAGVTDDGYRAPVLPPNILDDRATEG